MIKCFECDAKLSPKNFNEVEQIKTGETVNLCNACYKKLAKNGRLEVIDDDGNLTCGDMHLFVGTNVSNEIDTRPCPNCGSVTYLGKLIPTVTILSADYYAPSYQCHNPNCDPIFEKYEDDETGKISFDLIEFGAYWSAEDDCYYTPQSPRL